MMGDAAAVFDPELALAYYREALAGFATVDECDEQGEAANYFLGLFLDRQLHFLAHEHLINWNLARHRIPAKISQWLKA
ncbi:MAG: hypothetical protein ACM3XM_11475, partial [Mycobacterium leprae]